MQVVNGNEEKVLKALEEFGLCEYEARMYFTLLTIGEAKVTAITRKASVPQSKAYEVLDGLADKGFVELTQESPKEYRAINLCKVTERAVKDRYKQIKELKRKHAELQKLLEQLMPIHAIHNGPSVRLFSPKYKRR